MNVRDRVNVHAPSVLKVPLDKLRPKVIVRHGLGDLKSLTDSINKHSTIKPLLVSDPNDGLYEVIDEFRKYLTVQLAGVRNALININLDQYNALEIVWEINRFWVKHSFDERTLIAEVFTNHYAVREASRRLRVSEPTLEKLAKAETLLALWKNARALEKLRQPKLKANLKLAEHMSRKGYSIGKSDELARRLNYWAEDPESENIDELAKKINDLVWIHNLRHARIGKPVLIDSEKSYEELMIKCSYDSRIQHDLAIKIPLKIIDFKDRYEDLSGLFSPRCRQPIKCECCGAIVNCLYGYLAQIN